MEGFGGIVVVVDEAESQAFIDRIKMRMWPQTIPTHKLVVSFKCLHFHSSTTFSHFHFIQ